MQTVISSITSTDQFHASNHVVEAVLMCLLVRMTYWMLSFLARTVEYEGDHNRNQKVTKTLAILGRVGERPKPSPI